MKINGGCHCGYITYEAEIDPEKVSICHCTDCQTGSGSAYRTNVQTEKSTFKLLTGRTEDLHQDHGRKREQARAGFLSRVRHAALLDDRHRPAGLRPARRIDPAAGRAAAQVARLVPLRPALDPGPERAAAVSEAAAGVSGVRSTESDE